MDRDVHRHLPLPRHPPQHLDDSRTAIALDTSAVQSMDPRDDNADEHNESTEAGPSRRRRGLGFFPDPVVIKSAPYPDGSVEPSGIRQSKATGPPPRVPQSYSSWDEWKAWNTGPASTLSHKPPPVFVRPDVVRTGFEEGADGGFGVDVQTESEQEANSSTSIQPGKADGKDIANWYRSLAAKQSEPNRAAAESKVKLESDAPDLPASEVKAAPSAHELRTDTTEDIKPSRAQLTSADENSTQRTSEDSKARASSAPPPPLRVSSSEWFIRRALAKRHAASHTPSPPPPRSSSIGGMLNIAGASTRPPPRPHYAIGPENVGYARLSSLGWGGGGLGRPLDPGDAGSRPRTVTPPEGSARSASPSLSARPTKSEPLSPERASANDDDLEDLEKDEFVAGPGRTQPIPTALKLDRRGLGSAALEKKVTHTSAEIRRAQRKAGRQVADQKHVGKREKVKWAAKDKREREERKRLLAALNA